MYPHIARTERTLLASQGAFYLAAGLWPIVHRSSFERATGPKTDFWLVRTVGAAPRRDGDRHAGGLLPPGRLTRIPGDGCRRRWRPRRG